MLDLTFLSVQLNILVGTLIFLQPDAPSSTQGLRSGRHRRGRGGRLLCCSLLSPPHVAVGAQDPVGSQGQKGGEAEDRELCLLGWPGALWPGRSLELARLLVGIFVNLDDPLMVHVFPSPQVLL